jgi:lysozyme
VSFSIDKLETQLIRHEGLRLRPYTDTVGKLTIGVGHNLTDLGITKDQAMRILAEDIELVEAQLAMNLPWSKNLDEVRSRALMDLCFNLGITKLLEFHNTLTALKEGRWADAAKFLLDSLYAKQVGQRAKDLAHQFETGQDPV